MRRVIRLIIRVRWVARLNLKIAHMVFYFERTIRLTLSVNFDGPFEDGSSVSDSLCTKLTFKQLSTATTRLCLGFFRCCVVVLQS